MMKPMHMRLMALWVPVLVISATALAQEEVEVAPPAPTDRGMMFATIIAIVLILAIVAVSMKKAKREHRD